ENVGGGVKADFQGHRGDFSLNGFHGSDPAPYLAIGKPSLFLHPRMTAWGGDFAYVLGGFGFSGESAWLRYGEPGLKKDRLFSVAGMERTVPDFLTVRLQIVQVHLLEPLDPVSPSVPGQFAVAQAVFNGEADADTYALTMRVSRNLRNDEVRLSANAMFNATRRDAFLEPRIEYFPNGKWKASLGGEWYAGETASLFGRLVKNNCVQAELVRFY